MSNSNPVPQTPAPDGHEIPEQPKFLVRAAVSEVQERWAATLTSAESVRDRQYDFLGATYAHSRLIAANPEALERLRTSLLIYVTCSKRVLKRLHRTGAPELMLAAALGFGEENRSLRSKYKRVLEAAARAGVRANRESFHDWLRQEGGHREGPRQGSPAEPPRRCGQHTFGYGPWFGTIT